MDKVQFRCIRSTGPWNVGEITAVIPGVEADRLHDSGCWEVLDSRKDAALAKELADAGVDEQLAAKVVGRGYTVELLRRASLGELRSVFGDKVAYALRAWQETRNRKKPEPKETAKRNRSSKGTAKE